jgi:drug/metabolite transporter (DMT)-like permease
MRIAVLACLSAALLFGAATPLSKQLLGDMGAFTLAGLLYLGAALAVAPFSARGGSPKLRQDPVQRRLLVATVCAGGLLGPVFLLLGLRTAPAASVSLWLNGEIVATVILASLFFHEHIGRRGVAAAALILAAGVLLALPEGVAGMRAGLFVALACVCWGLDNNLTAIIGGFTPAQTTLAKGLVAGSVNLFLGLLVDHRLPGPLAIAAALALGALAFGLSIMLYINGAQQLGAARAQLLFATGPFLGVLLSWGLFQEPVQAIQIGAAPLIALGLALLLTGRHEHGHSHVPVTHTHGHRHDDGHHDHVGALHPESGWHTHVHTHEARTHAHPHVSDLHHRHDHAG